ncbi:hypothetical protein JTE90_027738 [Oedothorax gibbosus]|uniref:Uncharacterized protein n=1 Tax=Oedothorax gibbosus TaxID=931172 RepID=A0AAV6UJ65_9ARAC|nr:hypothetical protein JTE90_027738 [Oedothorax gibbosus]
MQISQPRAHPYLQLLLHPVQDSASSVDMIDTPGVPAQPRKLHAEVVGRLVIINEFANQNLQILNNPTQSQQCSWPHQQPLLSASRNRLLKSS